MLQTLAGSLCLSLNRVKYPLQFSFDGTETSSLEFEFYFGKQKSYKLVWMLLTKDPTIRILSKSCERKEHMIEKDIYAPPPPHTHTHCIYIISLYIHYFTLIYVLLFILSELT